MTEGIMYCYNLHEMPDHIMDGSYLCFSNQPLSNSFSTGNCHQKGTFSNDMRLTQKSTIFSKGHKYNRQGAHK